MSQESEQETIATAATAPAQGRHTSMGEWLMHVPGLRVIVPSHGADAKELMLAALRDGNSTVFIEHVRLYATRGQPLAGYSLDDCDTIMTNNVRHIVTWRQKDDISALAGKPVRLKFALRSAKLYAFEFQRSHA